MQKFLENVFMWGEVTLVLATLSLSTDNQIMVKWFANN